MSVQIKADPTRPGGYVLRSSCTVPRPLEEVFAFFSDAVNLEALTPAWLKFQVLTPAPIAMHEGQRNDYRLRVHGVPMRWTSEITVWDPPRRFVDEQRRGPYRHWHHEHLFESCDDGTRVNDVVHYAAPGGALLHRFVVKRDIERIFTFRKQALSHIFCEPA
jgi:ligand-binding SRPBCC domain-containing protein